MKDISWDRFDERNYSNPIYLPEGMTKNQLQECIDRARALKKEQSSD